MSTRLNKKFNFFVIFLLSVIFLFTCFSITKADELYTVTDAWEKKDVYRPSPILFLHGFAAGSPKTWQDVVDNLKAHHFDFYYGGENYGHSFGNKVSPYLESIQFFNEADHPEAGKNNSVDAYKVGDHYVDIDWRNAGDPGGADKVYYWLYEPSNANARLSYLSEKDSTGIILTYTTGSEKPKVNMICHSLGGLSARQFLKQYGAGDVAKLITVGTPHLGSPLASLSHDIDVGTQLTAQAVAAVGLLPRLSKILIPKIKVVSLLKLKFKIGIRKSAFISYVSGVKNTRVNLPDIAGIDIQGDAIRDLIPGCAFLNQLNSSVPGGPEYYCVYGQYRAGGDHVGVDLIGGDMVVPVASQKADGVGIPWKEVKRIYTNHVNEGATLAKDDCKILLGFLDNTEPVLDLVRVLESKDKDLSAVPEGEWGAENTDWTQHLVSENVTELDISKYDKVYIEGKVNKEYLPATSEAKIAVFKRNKKKSATYDEDELKYWGFESDDFGYVTKKWSNLEEAKESKYLKPYANQTPAPAGFRYKVEFNFEDPDRPEPGIYEAKVFVENPAGLKSEIKTSKIAFYSSTTGLNSGYWDGIFAFIHKNAYGSPLLYKYPFDSAGIDLDFPTVGGMCGSRVGNWWLGAGGWFEIEAPTQWTDPSWDKVSRVKTYFTDKTKCNGRVYLYKVGATYYIRIWTLTNGIWGYVTHSGWYSLDNDYIFDRYFQFGIWEWDGDVFYTARGYCKNGVLINDLSGCGSSHVVKKIIVGNAFTYTVGGGGTSWNKIQTYTKSECLGNSHLDYRVHSTIYSYGADNCIAHSRNRGTGNYEYRKSGQPSVFPNGGTFDEFPTTIPVSSFSGSKGSAFDGGEGGKVLKSYGSSNERRIEGFDPVANSWTDYGCPWEEE